MPRSARPPPDKCDPELFWSRFEHVHRWLTSQSVTTKRRSSESAESEVGGGANRSWTVFCWKGLSWPALKSWPSPHTAFVCLEVTELWLNSLLESDHARSEFLQTVTTKDRLLAYAAHVPSMDRGNSGPYAYVCLQPCKTHVGSAVSTRLSALIALGTDPFSWNP